MAGFEVIIYGRFWVITEVARFFESLQSSSMRKLNIRATISRIAAILRSVSGFAASIKRD
jgi:hypothetical protein